MIARALSTGSIGLVMAVSCSTSRRRCDGPARRSASCGSNASSRYGPTRISPAWSLSFSIPLGWPTARSRATRGHFYRRSRAEHSWTLTNPALPGRRRSDRIPAAIKPIFFWISQTRRMALNQLERLRLGTRRRGLLVGRIACNVRCCRTSIEKSWCAMTAPAGRSFPTTWSSARRSNSNATISSCALAPAGDIPTSTR